ncbi:peptidoglycan D,D-transpeptidase FtsI family protein [Enterococcus olivae]
MQKLKKFLPKKNQAEPTAPTDKHNRKSHVPFRLNLLFFVIFGLFVTLIAQLGSLQIIDNQQFEQQLKAASVFKIQGSTPRGQIYDTNGEPLVENVSNAAITFTRGYQMAAKDLLQTAQRLNDLIEIEVDEKLTERDLKDYWLADPDHLAAAQELLTDEEKQAGSSQEYAYLVEKVTDEQIAFDQEDLKAATLFKRLNSAQQLTTVFVKNEGVTDRELAVVSERGKELPGISTGMDWDRNVVTDVNAIQTLIGRVSKDGLQADNAQEYLDKGYAYNDRIGTSFLEKQYEEILQGVKSEQEITVNQNGNIESQKEVFSGEKGDNLVLTIDSEFQQKVDDIVKNVYQNLIDVGAAEYSPGVYVVAMNPKTGAIIAMSGYYHDIETNELSDNVIGTYQHAFEPGSVMKAGTLTAGWESGVLQGNQELYDQPIYLQGSNPKASIFNRQGYNNRNLTATKSLEISSNSYMIQVGLKMLGIDYDGKALNMPSVTRQAEVYQQIRDAYASYGMGVKTGIDLPDEATGLRPDVSELSDENFDAAKILDLTFGQFDTYTAMQLAQYVATIANDGKRVQPHLVEGIYGNDDHGNLGELKEEFGPNVLNEVNISEENMNIIQQGFYDVVHGSDAFTTGRALQNTKIDLAAKTGTAEGVVYDDGKAIDVDSRNLVSYGPYSDPEIALAVVVPQISTGHRVSPNTELTRQIMNAYYDTFMADR